MPHVVNLAVSLSRNLRPIIGLLLILGATHLFARAYNAAEKQSHESEVELAQDRVLGHISRDLATLTEVVRSIRAFYDGSEFVSREEFALFTQPLLDANPHLGGLEWVPVVPHSERRKYEREARRDGLLDFTFTEKLEDGRLVEATERELYMPVFYAHPYESNQKAVGYDLASCPIRRHAIEEASSTGKATLSAPISLVQDSNPTLAALLFIPIYHAADREQETPRGFALGLIRLSDIFAAGITQAELPCELQATDLGVDEEALLFRSGAASVDVPPLVKPTRRIVIDLAGRSWEFTFGASRDTISHGRLLFIWILGALLSVLVYEYLRVREEAVIRNHALQSAHDALCERSREITRFYHMASHELKTPLTSAREFTALLLDEVPGELNDEQRQFLRYIRESCDLLTRYINDMLDVTRLDTGKLSLRPKLCDPAILLEDMIAVMRKSCAARDLELVSAIPQTSAMVYADPQRLKQVVSNLLGNAIKFTPDGGRITLRVEPPHPRGNHVTISVEDTGVGISARCREKVFKRLYQVHAPDDDNAGCCSEGLGLGLSICKEIVLLHGGDISVESELGRGSTFKFTIPVAAGARRPIPSMEEVT
jgi:signal transduction histidine kinase